MISMVCIPDTMSRTIVSRIAGLSGIFEMFTIKVDNAETNPETRYERMRASFGNKICDGEFRGL